MLVTMAASVLKGTANIVKISATTLTTDADCRSGSSCIIFPAR